MWIEGPDYESGFYVNAPWVGEDLAGIPFKRWHAALVDGMHWAYEPEAEPPRGWVRLD